MTDLDFDLVLRLWLLASAVFVVWLIVMHVREQIAENRERACEDARERDANRRHEWAKQYFKDLGSYQLKGRVDDH